MNTKLRTSLVDPRKVNHTIFHTPFNPKINFALEDPLLLSSNEAVQKEGISYARYFCANSPLSEKASEFLKRKKQVENLYSKKAFVDQSVILSYQENCLLSLEKSFLSSQVFLIPDTITSPFCSSKTIYFPHSNILSIIEILKTRELDHTPILYLPKICTSTGRINFSEVETLKNALDIFLIVEDEHTFGLEGLNGFSKKSDTLLIDVLITHIPKNFGKMLTIISGSADLLDRFMQYSFSHNALFPPAAYLGMFSSMVNLLDSMKSSRDHIHQAAKKLSQAFPDHCKIYNPLIIFTFESEEEKLSFYKSLVDNGFLLPWSTSQDKHTLTFFLNYQLEETCIHFIKKALVAFPNQVICETL